MIAVPGEYINPYALGHFINHPPKGIGPNVFMIDLLIPNHFFTVDYLRFLPNIRFSTEKVTKENEINEYIFCDVL